MGTRESPIRCVLGIALSLLLAPSVFAEKTIYVAASASVGNGGTSWADAYKSLSTALANASERDEIRVAQGEYRPAGTPESAFHLARGVHIKGGYAGPGAADPDARNIQAYETVLSGDIDGDKSLSGNSYQVIIADGADPCAVLDGFTITGGNACDTSTDHKSGGGMSIGLKGGSPTLRHCWFHHNAAVENGGAISVQKGAPRLEWCRFSDNEARSGGGMYTADGNAVLIHCVFVRNMATQKGGGIYSQGSGSYLINCAFQHNFGPQGGGMYNQDNDPCLINCIFSHNSAVRGGGATYHQNGNSAYINCTFSLNSSIYAGGGMYSTGASPTLTNCILWGNSDTSGNPDEWEQIYMQTGVPTVSRSCVQGWMGDWPGNYNTSLNPMFVEGDDPNLRPDSPCVNTGDSSALPRDQYDADGDGDSTERIPIDYAGRPRISGTNVDRGALELQAGPSHGPVLYVDADAPGTGDGRSWTAAFNSLQAALDVAGQYDKEVREIRVAVGVYRPEKRYGGPRTETFRLAFSNVTLRGGYAGLGATDPNARDIKMRETRLSGDLSRNDTALADPGGLLADQTRRDNCYHVVTADSGTDVNTLLDGFTITGGTANELPNEDGAGLYIWGQGLTVRQCTFWDNAANGCGGGIYCSDSSPNIQSCTIGNNAAGCGGGLYCYRSSPAVTGSTITGNHSEQNGAGILCESESSPFIAGNTIAGNRISKRARGGGICCTDGSNATITRNLIADNYAYDGGGVYINASDPNIVNNLVVGNEAEDDGGGLCFEDCARPLVRNNTIVQNTANPQGGGIYCDNARAVITNCILWDNGDDFQNVTPEDSPCSITYSCIQDDDPGIGNIAIYPYFNDAANRDYGLKSDSPCINAGQTPETLLPGETDLDGPERISFAHIDMGAYETPSATAVDSDGDSLPDDWEREHFPGAQAMPGDDPDGDEVSNLDEYRRGTDPHVAPRAQIYVSSESAAGSQADGSPKHPFASIQQAINAVRDGGRILVTVGLFKERLIIDGKVVQLEGGYSADFAVIEGRTTLSAQRLGRVVLYRNVPGGSFTRFTVRDGSERDGGGMYFLNSSPIVTDNLITDNESFEDDGGGVAFYFGSDVQFIDNEVRGNTAESDNGGGIFCREASPTIRGCLITENHAEDAGAIRLRDADPSIIDCNIIGNTASNDGGGIVCKEGSRPIIENCTISDNSADWNDDDDEGRGGGLVLLEGSEVTLRGLCVIQGNASADPRDAGLWASEGCRMTIEGTVQVRSNDWTARDLAIDGRGRLQIDSETSLKMDDCSLACDVNGPGDIEVQTQSELLIHGDALVNLKHPDDPSGNGVILCKGLLRIKDNVQIRDTHINVSRASFEGGVAIKDSTITTAAAGAPYGQFFLEDTVHVTGTEIHADGDRYMDLDPSAFHGEIEANNHIYVTITEGIGTAQGGLFELRGKPDVVKPLLCDLNNPLLCRIEDVPPFGLESWMIEELRLVDGAKVNLTNRFDFQDPFGEGGDDEVLYVRKLYLGKGSVLNTCFNRIYYQTREGDPCAVVENVPLLGFSLNNIAFDDEEEFNARIEHNNVTNLPDDEPDQIYVKWVNKVSPDPCGVMQMCNLVDDYKKSPTYGQVVQARAKGLFAKSNEPRIQVKFEYLFCDPTPPGKGELVVYLSDSPELLDYNDPDRATNYIEVGHVYHPPGDRPGSVGSGRWGVFDEMVAVGHLNFVRGTRIELELKGPAGVCVWINNFDPGIRCPSYVCGDMGGDHAVEAIDFLVALSECGRRIDPAIGCLEGFFSTDGYATVDDAMAVDWGWLKSLCPQKLGPGDPPAAAYESHVSAVLASAGAGLKPGLSMAAAETQDLASLQQIPGMFLVATKGYKAWNKSSYDFLSGRLYGLDVTGTAISGRIDVTQRQDRLNGKLARDRDGTLYQVNLELGLVRITDGEQIVTPGVLSTNSEPRWGLPADVYIGFQETDSDSWGRPLLDAAFDKEYVYVVPVVVDPASETPSPYLAAARLKPGDTSQSPRIFDVPLDVNDNIDPNQLREVEVDAMGRVYVLNRQYRNSSDFLWVYDSEGGLVAQQELAGIGITAPTGLCVSSQQNSTLYLASTENEPNADSATLYVLSLSSHELSLTKKIQIRNMGHVTDIAEDPGTGTVCVLGFVMPSIPSKSDLQNIAAMLKRDPFYQPRLATIRPSENGPVDAVCPAGASSADKWALPLSIVYAGPE